MADPMQLFSPNFSETANKAIDGKKAIFAIIHLKASDSLLDEVSGP